MYHLRTLLKVLMFLGSVVFSLFFLFIGILFAGPTTLFSAPNSPTDRISGLFSLVTGLVVFVLSFSLFRQKFTKSAIFLFSVITIVVFSGFGNGPSMDSLNLYYLYAPVAVFLYFVNKKIENSSDFKKQEYKSQPNRINKILIIIPIAIIFLVFFYFTFLEGLINEIQNKKYTDVISDKNSYQQFVPKYLPSGYKKGQTSVGGAKSNYFFTTYTGIGGWFTLAQFKKPSQLNLSSAYCSIYGSGNDNFEVFYGSSMASGISGSCELVVSTKGRNIYVMQNPLSNLPRNYAVVIIDNTLISIDGFGFSDEELIKLVDNLEVKN